MTRLLLVALCLTSCAHRSAGNDASVVRVSSGELKGVTREGGVAFLGIPYAAPPQRWKAPQPPLPWSGRREALKKGPACPQPNEGVEREQSEDCLSLNLWVPATPNDGPRPVMVWLHGGAFYLGEGADELYDGAKLAEVTGAIVVSFNYRLGALGFLSLGEVAKEGGVEVAPAVGLLDQRAALQWVQREIGAFGGDAANVTVFGESAGAWSICSHLAMPGSKGLFAKAVMQSGACSDALYVDGARAQQQGDELAAAVGCTGEKQLPCLRAAPIDQLVNALKFRRGMLLQPGVWWGPVVDGVELPELPLQAIRAGRWNRTPLLTGFMSEEGNLHTVSLETVSDDELQWFTNDVFGPQAVKAVAAHYRRDTPKQSLTDVVADGIFRCNTRRVARELARQQVPVFVYEFTRALDNPVAHKHGPTHSVDLFFVFGNESMGIGLSQAEQPLSRTVMQAWGRFARTGSPTGSALTWPGYDAKRDEVMLLGDLLGTAGGHSKACDFWDGLEAR